VADNVVAGTGAVDVATRKVTYSGDANQNAQAVGLVAFSGSDDAKTATDIPGDASNGLDVDVTRIQGTATVAGTVAVSTATVGGTVTATLPDITSLSQALVTTATTNAVTVTTINGQAAAAAYVSFGSATGTLIFEGSIDGTDYFTVPMVAINSGAIVTSATATGQWQGDVGGMSAFRVRVSVAGTGTATVSLRITNANPVIHLDAQLPAGTNTLGAISTVATVTTATVGGTVAVSTVTGVGTVATLTTGTVGVTGSVTVAQATAASLNCTEASASGIRTAVELIDDIVYTDDTSTHSTGTSKGALFMAAATPTDASVNANDIGAVAMTTDRKLHVSVQDALPAGTNAIGKLAANSGVDIGDVDITSIAAGDNNIGNVDIVTMPNVTLAAGTNTNEFVGDVAHDAVATAVNPITVGGYASAAAPTDVSADGDAVRAWHLRNGAQATVITAAGALVGGDATNGLDVDVTRISGTATVAGTLAISSLPASTNTIEVVGDIAHDTGVGGNPVQIAAMAVDCDDTAPPLTVSAEQDVVRLAADRDGAVFVRPHGPRVWSYHEDSSTALTDATVHSAPASGLSLYVGSIVVSTGAATAMNVFFEEGSTKVLGPYYLEATAGRGFQIQFNPPKKITAATALTITTSAAIAHSIDVTGFTAQG
jgi:hypothetical protein